MACKLLLLCLGTAAFRPNNEFVGSWAFDRRLIIGSTCDFHLVFSLGSEGRSGIAGVRRIPGNGVCAVAGPADPYLGAGSAPRSGEHRAGHPGALSHRDPDHPDAGSHPRGADGFAEGWSPESDSIPAAWGRNWAGSASVT